jgi:hypothetical protein
MTLRAISMLPAILALAWATSGCDSRAPAPDLTPLSNLLGQVLQDAALGAFPGDGGAGGVNRRTPAQRMADLATIPPAVTAAVDRRQDVAAETPEELLEVLGLTPYASHLIFLGVGDPLLPEIRIFYRKDACIAYRLDAVRRRIIGGARVVPPRP